MSVWLSCGFQSNDSSLSDVALADTTAARGTPTASSSSDGGPHVSFVRFHRCFLLRNTCTIRQHCVSNLTVSLVKKTFSLKNEKKTNQKKPKRKQQKKKKHLFDLKLPTHQDSQSIMSMFWLFCHISLLFGAILYVQWALLTLPAVLAVMSAQVHFSVL